MAITIKLDRGANGHYDIKSAKNYFVKKYALKLLDPFAGALERDPETDYLCCVIYASDFVSDSRQLNVEIRTWDFNISYENNSCLVSLNKYKTYRKIFSLQKIYADDISGLYNTLKFIARTSLAYLICQDKIPLVDVLKEEFPNLIDLSETECFEEEVTV